MLWEHKNKTAAAVLFTFFIMVGTYNSVVINSESQLNGKNIKLVKRLDEVYGNVKAGREVAASISWRKIKPAATETTVTVVRPMPVLTRKKVESHQSAPTSDAATVNSEPAQAALQEELSLQLVEVINPAKWKDGLKPADFSGSLESSNGMIESLNVSLPNGGFSVAFAEMTGNVFEYDHEGEVYSGMIYQVDDKSYMVSLTNGPYEGTRLKFNTAPVETETYTAEHTLPAGPDLVVEGQMTDAQMQEHGYNFNQQQTM
jgi:hypothetical protein